MQTENKKWCNIIGVLVLLIVIGHFIEPFIDISHSFKTIWLFIYSFHIPLFFIITGYFHKDENITKCCFLFFLLSGIVGITALIGNRLLSGTASLLQGIEIPRFSGTLLCVALFIILAFVVRDMDPYFVLCISLLFGIVFSYEPRLRNNDLLSRIVAFFPYYLLGRCLNINKESFLFISKKAALKALSVIIISGWLVLCCIKTTELYLLRPFFTENNPFTVSEIEIEGVWIRMFCYFISTLIGIAFIILIPEKRIPLLTYLGTRASQILVLHTSAFYIIVGLMPIGFILSNPEIAPIARPAYLAAVCMIVVFLSINALSAPFIYLEQKCQTAKSEQAPRLFKQRRIQNGSFTLSKKDWLSVVATAVFFVFTILLYGPLSLYLENAQELWFSLKTTLTIIIPVSLAGFALIIFIAWALPNTASKFAIRLLFGITLAMYIQGTLINTNYGGVLNGQDIEWNQYLGYGAWTLLVWVGCIALPFVLSKISRIKTEMVLVTLSLFFTAIQIPALVVESINYTPGPGAQGDLLVSKDGEFEFGKKENIIVIALDTLDEAYYKEYITDHPETEKLLDGFIHYDNTLASGAYTILGVPSMLTGEAYKHASTYSEYISDIWGKENPLAALHKNGYDVRVYTESIFFSDATTGFIDNYRHGGEKVGSYKVLAQKLYKLTLYKFSQHFIKPFFWFDTAEFIEAQGSENRYQTDDSEFYKDFLANGISISKANDKSFHFYLLNGAHSPYKLTQNAEMSTKKTSRKEQIEGDFKIVTEMIIELKKKGIYDSSTIILTADHGEQDVAQHQCFLYKMPFANQPYTTSHAPVSMFDLPVLLYKIAGYDKTGEYGTDFTLLDENEIRERHFFYNHHGTSNIAVDEYVTFSTANDFYELMLVSTHEDQTGAIPVEIGTTLTFDRDATGNRYVLEGFGNNTGYRSKLYGPYAKLAIPIANLPREGTLHIHINLHNKSKTGYLCNVLANGERVLSEIIDNKLIKRGIDFTVPVANVGIDNLLTIELLFPEIEQDEMLLEEVNFRTETISFTKMTISLLENE